MATAREWSVGFLEQARADVAAAVALSSRPPSVVAMLLQMAFEKLAKAALLRAGTLTVEEVNTHKAAFQFLALLRRRSRDGREFGFQHQGQWRGTMKLAKDLAKAHPKLSQGGPHLEYPWEDHSGIIRWPERDLPAVAALASVRDRRGPFVLGLAAELAKDFDRFFP